MEYDYYSGYSSVSGLEGLFFGVFFLLIIAAVIGLIVHIFSIICMWKIFVKAGKAGWIALVPLYNAYTLFEITWGNGWYCLTLLIGMIPIIGWIVDVAIFIITLIKLGDSFKKSTGFIVGLSLVGIIFIGILAYDSSTYEGPSNKVIPVNKKEDTKAPTYNNQMNNNVEPPKLEVKEATFCHNCGITK